VITLAAIVPVSGVGRRVSASGLDPRCRCRQSVALATGGAGAQLQPYLCV